MDLSRCFEFKGHEVRVVGTPERPRWVAKDVCKALGSQTLLLQSEIFSLMRRV